MKNLIIILSLVLSSCSIYKNAFVQEDLGKEKIVIKTKIVLYNHNYKTKEEFMMIRNKACIYYEDGKQYVKSDIPKIFDYNNIGKFIIEVDSVKSGYGNYEESGFRFKWKTWSGHDTVSNKLYSVSYYDYHFNTYYILEIKDTETGMRYRFYNKSEIKY